MDSVIFLFFIIQNQSSYAQQARNSQTGDSSQDAELLREDLARKRKARKASRRKKFLSTLPKNHNPKTASLLALIPGAGQIYNRRYWKLPIVYGGLGALGYFTVSSYINYTCYRQAYLHAVDGDSTTNYQCSRAPGAAEGVLKVYRDQNQQSAEFLLLGFTLFYGLTIVDAFVDAHLMHFDIDDDLSLQIRPNVNYSLASQTVMPTVSLAIQARPKVQAPFPVQF